MKKQKQISKADAETKKWASIMSHHGGGQQVGISLEAVIRVEMAEQVKLLLESDGHSGFVRPACAAT